VKRITGTLHEDQCTLLIISRSVILIMKTVSYKGLSEHHITSPSTSSVIFFPNILPIMR